MRSFCAVIAIVALSGCQLDVFPDFFGPPPPRPTHLDILERSVSVPEGQSRSLSVVIDNCDTSRNCIMWSSSNFCVADALMTSAYGWHYGTAVLHAISIDVPTLRDSVVVTVTPVSVASVRLAVDSVAIAEDGIADVSIKFYDASEHWIHRPAVAVSADTLVVRAKPIDTCTSSTSYIELLPQSRGTTIVIARFESLADTVRVTVF